MVLAFINEVTGEIFLDCIILMKDIRYVKEKKRERERERERGEPWFENNKIAAGAICVSMRDRM